MKRNIILVIVAALATLAVSCQKEEAATVTLGARIEESVNGDAKAYIDGYTPCWHNGDRVYINNTAYPIVAASGSSAQIENVTASSSYRALFPASIVTPGVDISENSTFPITLPSVQRYELVGDHQRVDVPMGAYLTNGSTLQFYNLCSIVRVTVSNSLNRALPLRHIAVRTDNAMLSGAGTAAVSGQSVNRIVLSNTASHSVCLGFNEESPVTVAARGSKTFDIVVPAFTTRDHVTFTLYTTDGYYFEMDRNNVALGHNSITTATMNVTGLTQIVAAELVYGPTFSYYIPDAATHVVFEYNSSVASGRLLSTEDSPTPIYGNLDGTTWRVSTAAQMINANPDCHEMFAPEWTGSAYRTRLETIDFGEGFNTENVTNMSEMFMACRSLTSLDLSHFNTSNVTDMSAMFAACGSLTTLDVSHFNTSSVINMHAMFNYCYSLVSLDVSHFKTSNVIDMSDMFAACSTLTNLDVSNFNTGNVTNMYCMFILCGGLKSLDVSHFNTSNVTNMEALFDGCGGLTSLDVSHFNTSSVTNMNEMFNGCSSLTSLDVSNFNTSNVTSMGAMFMGCSGLTSLDVSHFNTTNVTSMGWMFQDCNNLTSLDLSNFNTSNVTEMGHMFQGCSSLTSLDLSNFNTGNVIGMGCMFEDCSGLVSLDISNFNTSCMISMVRAFHGCRSLTSLDVSHFNTSNVTDMYEMFDGCSSLTTLDVSHFNTSNVTTTAYMFCGCSGLTSLNVSGFNTSNVTDMSAMFSVCGGLTSLNVSNFSTSNVTNMHDMFMGCSSLSSLDVSIFNTSSVTDMTQMFANCNNLANLDLSNFDMSHLGNDYNNWQTGKEGMCAGLSTLSSHCTITCPLSVETAIKEVDTIYDPSDPYHPYHYITGLPTSGVTFTWQRPASSK